MGGTTKEIVKVPKDKQGKVIGKGAATLKDIESDYPGVKVTVPQRDDPSEDIIVVGPPDAVRHAVNRIKDIAGYNEGQPDKFRVQENKIKADIADLESQLEGKSGGERHQIIEKLKAKRQELARERERMADDIFKAKNSGYGLDQMDLHGLYLKEALEKVEERLALVDRQITSGQLELTIISGAGNHSKGNVSKIKQECNRLLTERGYVFREEKGLFVVTGKQPIAAGGAPQPQHTAAKPAAKPETAAARPPTATTEETSKAFSQSGWKKFLCVMAGLFTCCMAAKHMATTEEAPPATASGEANTTQENSVARS